MPRPRSLSFDQLAAATLAVIDRDGASGLTMRAVARELHLSTMGLYRYVREREELAALAVERVLATVDVTAPAGPDWRDGVTEMVGRIRTAILAHPGVVPLTVTHRHDSPSILRWSETVLGILTDGGLAGRQRVLALRALLCYVLGALQLQQLGPLSGAGTDVLAALPPDEFPHLRATARAARSVPPDEEFYGGLDFLLRGLAGGR